MSDLEQTAIERLKLAPDMSLRRGIGGRMKVLIACEESQEVCKAFRVLGYEAYSCDVQEPSGGHPEWHILGDVLNAIEGGK